MNKITVNYSITNYHKQTFYVSDELYNEVMDGLKEQYDEEDYEYYDSFEEFVDDVISEILYEMGIELNSPEDTIVDSDGAEITSVEFA
jgi:hypothetical protein